MLEELRGLGYQVPESQANFVWLPDGPAAEGAVDAMAFAAGCEERGLLVRAFAGSGVRITVSTAEENDRLIGAARELRG
jgi:histidinol-phosphate aminotransferase